MATRRIKEITNTATTFASDDFIALDGTSQGTRKMDKDDLISQVSAGVSGDYLEEANNLSDVASLDTSKLNLEVPDVGTGPQEVPLNSMLSSMAYQSADSVSVAELEVTDKVKGPLGIDGSPGSYAYSGADDLVVGDATGSRGITISTGSSDTGALYFGDAATTGLESYRGMVRYSHSSDSLELGTLSQVRATIDSSGRVGIGAASPTYPLQVEGAYYSGSFPFNVAVQNNSTAYNVTDNGSGIVFGGRTAASGGLIISLAGVSGCKANNTDGNFEGNLRVLVRENGSSAMTESARFTKDGLVMGSGMAIDFGSGASTTIDSYEHGDITSVTDASGASLAITADMKYQVIGKSVQISGKITFPTTTDTRAARVTLLPEQCPNADGARGLSVSYTTSGSGLYVMPVGNTNDVMFWNLSGTSQQNSNLSGLTIFISGNYSLN